jgi:hypothetical protein
MRVALLPSLGHRCLFFLVSLLVCSPGIASAQWRRCPPQPVVVSQPYTIVVADPKCLEELEECRHRVIVLEEQVRKLEKAVSACDREKHRLEEQLKHCETDREKLKDDVARVREALE